MKVLLTGFEAFNGGSVNPSEEIVKAISSPTGMELIKAVLPVAFEASALRLTELIGLHRPDIVLSLGQAGGRRELSVERVALNLDCVRSSDGKRRISDNEGAMPLDAPIVKEGPAAYFATIPLWETVEAIQKAGVVAALSNTAGTFVCNHVFYTSLHLAKMRYPHMKAGFIHVPFLPEQIEDREDKERLASMPLEEMVRGMEAALSFLGQG